jgi:hypothetical protein
MKKILYPIVTTMILAIALSGCQKDLEKSAQTDISSEDLEMAKKITSFIARMNSPVALKSAGFIDVDDAIWNVEAAANYIFADIPEQFADTKLDTLVFTLPVENGFCKENDLSALYQSVDAAIQEYCSTLGEYQLLGVDVNISEEIDGNIAVYIISCMPTAEPCDFEPDPLWLNWWRSGLGKGKCDDDPQYYGRDAATEIQKKANYCNPKPENTYYVSVTKKTFSGLNLFNPNYDPNDPYYPYWKKYLLYCDLTNTGFEGIACLSPDMMNFYLANLRHYATNVWKPAGKDIMSYTYKFNSKYMGYHPLGFEYSLEYHEGWITYGYPCKKVDYNPNFER